MNEIKGLLLTEEIRKKLYLSVEEAIRCHTSAIERDVQTKENEAREERLKLYKEVEEACTVMTEARALEIIFSCNDLVDIVKKWYQWDSTKRFRDV